MSDSPSEYSSGGSGSYPSREHSFALAVPHTPWVPERVESLERLLTELLDRTLEGPYSYRLFDEKEPNWSWSKKMWDWGASCEECTHFLQIQDDAIVAPNFWPTLRAMVSSNPDRVISFHGAHPLFRQLSADGKRWARSNWMVGVAYLLPMRVVDGLSAWRSNLPEFVYTTTNEDDLIGKYLKAINENVWHPIPTIVDHDTTIKSTYSNENNYFRKSNVTWRGWDSSIESPDFWKQTLMPPFVQNPHDQTCWFCNDEPGVVASASTGGRIGRKCVSQAANAIINGGEVRK